MKRLVYCLWLTLVKRFHSNISWVVKHWNILTVYGTCSTKGMDTTDNVLVECIAWWGERTEEVVLCGRNWCVCKWSSSKHVCEGAREGRDKQRSLASLRSWRRRGKASLLVLFKSVSASHNRRCRTRCCSNLQMLCDCVSASLRWCSHYGGNDGGGDGDVTFRRSHFTFRTVAVTMRLLCRERRRDNGYHGHGDGDGSRRCYFGCVRAKKRTMASKGKKPRAKWDSEVERKLIDIWADIIEEFDSKLITRKKTSISS